MKRASAIIICLAMCTALIAACAPAQTPAVDAPVPGAPGTVTPTPTPPQAPVVAVLPPAAEVPGGGRIAEHMDIIIDNSPIAILNPFLPAGGVTPNQWAYNLMYDRLLYPAIQPDGNVVIEPYLATRWETDDYQTFTFWLRDDVYFHNGDRFTANDVLWTISTAHDSVGSPAFNVWRNVAEAYAIDDTTLRLVLASVNVDFPFLLTTGWSGIVNERAMTEDPDFGVHIGTGAFIVAGFETNNYAHFVRNENYWGRMPYTQSMTLRFIPEPGARAMMLLNGEVQMCFRLADEDMALFVGNPDFNVFAFPMMTPNIIGFNMADPLMSCWYFRMAVRSALYLPDIAYGAAGDFGAPYHGGTLWGFDAQFRNDDIPQVPFDLERARHYLELSAYNGEEIEIATALAAAIRASEIVQMQLGRIGINARVNQMDNPSLVLYTQYGNNQSQIVVMGMVWGTPLASSIRDILFPGGSRNNTSFNNPVITDMIERAAATVDIGEREELYMEIQRLVAEDPPAFGIMWRYNSIVSVRGVGGLTIQTDTNYDLRWLFWQIDED